MVIKRSASDQVGRLVADLLGSDAVAQQGAAARLSILGPRALPQIESALRGAADLERVVRLLGVLEQLDDPRGVSLALPFLTDSRDAVASAAVAVARTGLHSAEESVASRAVDALLHAASAAIERPHLAVAISTALADLPEEVLRPLRGAGALAHVAPASRSADQEILGPDNAQQWLREWVEPDKSSVAAEQVRLAVDACGAIAPLSLLHRVVQRVRRAELTDVEDAATWRGVRGVVHQWLAHRDSRVAFYDLRETLEQAPDGLTVGMLGALSSLGDRSCLEALAAAWTRSADPWLRSQLKAVLLAVMKREGLDFRHGTGRQIASRHEALAQQINTTLQTTPSRRRPSHN